MGNKGRKIWYQHTRMIDCNISDINNSLNDMGQHYKELISVYPGITAVELLEQGKDYVTIKTNEGTMKRTNILVETSEIITLVSFDEEYITSKLTTHSQFVEKFESKDNQVEINIEISNLVAPGILGFFLRNFGSKNIGNGFVSSYQKTFEK